VDVAVGLGVTGTLVLVAVGGIGVALAMGVEVSVGACVAVAVKVAVGCAMAVAVIPWATVSMACVTAALIVACWEIASSVGACPRPRALHADKNNVKINNTDSEASFARFISRILLQIAA